MKLKNRIKEICIEKGISGYQLAKMIECHESHVYKVWSGKYGVSDDMAKRFAEALKVKIDHLFYVPSSDSE
jgi:transcriptional regulator with XRE-family HTH domain